MANDISGNPWVLDTAGLVKTSPNPNLTFTNGFVFRDYTGGAASLATITDGVRGTIVAKLYGNAAGTPVGEAWFENQVIRNLTLALDSGKVEVIIK